MFDRVKFSASALTGLAIGICLALPLFWIGVKNGLGSLESRAEHAFKAVEQRQQNMADEALRLEMNFKRVGAKVPKPDFVKVELLRSRLAGSGDFEDKIEISQELERALINIGTIYTQTMAKNPAAAASAYCREFGHNWGPMMRYLVDEEYQFSNAIKSYNNVLRTPPVPFVVGHKTFGSLLSALTAEFRSRFGMVFRQALAWIKFVPAWSWAKVRGKTPPSAPQAMSPVPRGSDALYHALPEPFYIAQAPVPEEDYDEIQYNRAMPDMADIEVGQQKAELDNGIAVPYVAPVPTIQRTATYH